MSQSVQSDAGSETENLIMCCLSSGVWSNGRVMITMGKPNILKENWAEVLLHPPGTSHEVHWDRTQSSTVRSQCLTA
jgi:hypothetical protein